MSRSLVLALTGAIVLAVPTSAAAAIASVDRACYVSGQPGVLSIAGFAPNAAVTLGNADLGSAKVTTDATGSFAMPFTPPSGTDLKRPGSRQLVFTATEDANPANAAKATSRIAPLAFATDKGTKSPKAKRSWYFSGWAVGRNIYAHFRLGGKTKGNYRMGRATGACGEYKRRAPGIAIKGAVRAGSWTIQVDQAKSYRTSTRPFLKDKTPVYTTFRPRAVTSAAATSTAALSGMYRFGGFYAGV